MGQDFVVFFIPYFVICLVLANVFGAKKRIGVFWSLFFLACYPVVGVIALILSPSLKNLPDDNPKDMPMNIILGIIHVLVGLGSLSKLFSTVRPYGSENYEVYLIISCFISFAGSYYFFNRSKRNKKLFFEKRIDELSRQEERQN